MKQVVQNLRSGAVQLEEVPPPVQRGPGVLVATACSVISPGTERAAIELGRSSLLGKALRRPDQVRKVLENLRREGLAQTWHKVQQRLDVTRAMGYSCAGIALEVHECDHIRPGDRVACAGTDAATHGELNFVPRNLCVPIPEGVSFEEAAFVALGGTALHAVHLAGATMGEDVAVLGLGPVGLLLAQVLRAAGCRVAGFDLRLDRLALAQRLGIERVGQAHPSGPEETLRRWNLARGFDSVFIAAASPTSEPVEWAVAAARDRAKIVVVGDVRTDFPRAACYAKELTILYARSYGPGRYEPQYEEHGLDYPRAYVPWTLGRNLAAFLDLVACRQVRVAPLISHRFRVDEAERAYEVVSGAEPSLGVVLEYPLGEQPPSTTTVELKPLPVRSNGSLHVSFIGAGSYAKSYLLPALKQHHEVHLVGVATARGITAKKTAEQFGFARCATDAAEILRDADMDVVFIATPHDLHGALTAAAIEAGKAVFVEKPLCLTEEELDRIIAAYRANPVLLMVGHNRRFAPATTALAEFLEPSGTRRSPLSIRYMVHASALRAGHWLHDPAQGGRIRGEVCHFLDWCNALVGAPLEKLFATIQGSFPDENLHAVLNYADGSVATISYDTGAHYSLPKEVIEVSSAGRTAVVEDFAQVTFLTSERQWTQRFRGKGQNEMVSAFLAGIASGQPPIPFDQWAASARATLKLLESASSGLPVWLSLP
jgi:predicted dehydrogenase/threonine dehydrogenase-like Zn-dependent dehydrogenase